MDQSAQNSSFNGADISSSSSNTTQRLVSFGHSRQMMAPLATIARPEPNLLWPSQSSQSYTQMHPNTNVQNDWHVAPRLPGNIPGANQSSFTPYSSIPFGSQYIMPQSLPYNNRASYPFNSYPGPFQAGHVPSSGSSTTYPQNQIASSPYYNNGVGGSLISESSLAGALCYTRAVNDNLDQIISSNAVSETPGQARIDDSVNLDIRTDNRGGSEEALSKSKKDEDSTNLSNLYEFLGDGTWSHEASSRIVQTVLTLGNTTNTTRKEAPTASVAPPVNYSSVIMPTPSVGSSNSLQANQRVFLPTPEPSRIPPTSLDIMQNRIPQTPDNYQPHVVTTPSSGSANRATLARDILWALQPAGIKRKRPVYEDHSSVAVSGKKSKTGNIDYPSISDVVPLPELSIPLTSTTSLNDMPVQIPEVNSGIISHGPSIHLTPTSSSNNVPNLEARVPEPEPIDTSLVAQETPQGLLDHSTNQPDNFARDLPPLPPSGTFDAKSQSPHPLSAEIQPGQSATDSNNLLHSSPQSTRSASIVKVPTLLDKPAEAEIQSDQSLPSASSASFRVRTPLFLPSEPSSPIQQHSSDDDPLTLKKEVIYIDDDEPSQSVSSTGAITIRFNIRPYVLVPRLKNLSVKGKKTVISQPSGNIGRGKRAVELEVPEVQDSRSRLTLRRCLWRKCSAVLDSAEKLIKHTKVVHGNTAEEGIYKCQWTDCRLGTYFTSEDLKRHLKGHVQSSITCPYKGCTYETKRADNLANHMATNHNTRQVTLRPLATPSELSMPPCVELVQIRPAYYSIPIPVIGKPISRERHYRLGPSIRNQIIGNYKPEKQSLKTIALGGELSSLMTRTDDYGFQQEESPSRTHSSLRQVSPVVNDIDLLEGSVLDSVVIMERRFDGSLEPETASDANVDPRVLDDGLGIDLGPNILQGAPEEHESLEVETSQFEDGSQYYVTPSAHLITTINVVASVVHSGTMTDTDTQVPTTSSYSDTSTSTLQQLVAPNYVSAGSADVILSEVRPTRMKSEALRSLNVLLDELLWLILGHARSFSPVRLKAGLARVLPTVLGKDALLEAEVELRAYIDRNPLGPIEPVDDSSLKKFPLQPAFELLRMKCEAYSSLGDQEENIDIENALYSRVLRTNKDITIPRSLLAPAGLYLTAILEHICEHILSSVGRVVARDSSRTTAHSSDLYTALCEDESIYPLFKTMKVQDQIEQQSKPRRSESSSHNEAGPDLRMASPDPPIPLKSRPSIESAISNGSASRPSMDKNRTKGFFKSSLADTKFSGGDNLRRSNSLVGNKLPDASATMEDIDESFQDFDVLMRSGNTMKVSLTPDRLKTFEVFSKEKNLRAGRPGPQSQLRDANNPPFPTTTIQSPKIISARSRNEVEAIAEAPEIDLGRSRSASTSGPSSRPTTPRTRSYTQVQATSSTSIPRQDHSRSSTSKRPMMPTAITTIDPNAPKRNRRPPARNRESLDLDQIMNGSDEELALQPKLIPQPKKPMLTPKSAQMTSGGTRDLLEFLSEGPPEPLSPPPLSSSATFSDGKNVKSGRLRTIVSRLTGNSAREEHIDPVLRQSINSSAPRPAPLNTKRSIPNVSATTALLQTSYPHDTPISPTRARDISNSRGRAPEWEDHAKESIEVTPRKQNDTGNAKPVSHLNGRESEHSYRPTPRKPVPAFDLSKTAVEPPPSPIKPQSSMRPPPPTETVATSEISTTTLAKTDSAIIPSNGISHMPSEEEIDAFRRHVARAGSADECRVLVDMLLSRCHLLRPSEEKECIAPKAEPSTIDAGDLETQMVELLLGESDDFSPFHPVIIPQN